MLKIVNFAQIVVSVVLMVLILLQNKGTGLGTVFGGEGGIAHTKRGPEKWVFYGTIVGVVIFVALGVVNLYLVSQGAKTGL